MHDGMPYGRIQGQGQGHELIQGSRIENLQSREVDRQSPTGLIFIRSTSKSRPNNIRGKNVRPYVRPSTKSFFDLNEIWYVGRGR